MIILKVNHVDIFIFWLAQVRIRFIHIFESCRNTLRNALVLSSEQSLVLVRQWLPYVYISLFLRYYRQSRDRSDQMYLFPCTEPGQLPKYTLGESGARYEENPVIYDSTERQWVTNYLAGPSAVQIQNT